MRTSELIGRIVSAAVYPSILFGVGYGLLGALFNGFRYGFISTIGSVFISFILGVTFFSFVAGPALIVINRLNKLSVCCISITGIVLSLFACIIIRYWVYSTIDVNAEEAFWVTITFVAIVLIGGCLVLAFNIQNE